MQWSKIGVSLVPLNQSLERTESQHGSCLRNSRATSWAAQLCC